MKISKIKETVTESIELQSGVYYYQDSNYVLHKFEVTIDEEGYVEYTYEILNNWSNLVGITVKTEEITEEEELPWSFIQLILEKDGKKVSADEYNKERQEILKRITDVN